MTTATISSSSGSVYEGAQRYPYPSHVNAASFVSIKLSGKPNYKSWKYQILCLVESHDMLGFIDGSIKNPQVDGCETKADYKEWKRSDALVKGWMCGSLSEDVMGTVVDLDLEKANDIWNKLEEEYSTQPAPDSDASSEEGEDGDQEEYVSLCRAIQMGDWEKAQRFLNENKDALTDKLNDYAERTVHVAVGNPDNIPLLEKLLELINPELLPTLVDNRKQNALHHAAKLDNTDAAKKLVEKNPDLLFTVDENNELPIHRAIINSHETTFLYLLQVCKHHISLSQKEGHHNPFKGVHGALLLFETIYSGFLGEQALPAKIHWINKCPVNLKSYLLADVAYELLEDFPKLATTTRTDFNAPLHAIAARSEAYLSAKRYNFYQRFVYSHLPTESYLLENTHNTHDIENQETYLDNVVTMGRKSYIYPVIKRIYGMFWKVARLHVQHIKHLHEDKVKHETALKILKIICKEVGKLKSDQDEHYEGAFIVAVENNTLEVIQMITRTFPQAIWTSDDNEYTLPQLSIINRCENGYNFLVHEVTQDKYLHKVCVDNNKNNLLHLAGRLAPTHKLNMVTGAALQMQREIQWFEEVKRFMRPREREEKNDNQETPIIVFRKEHKDLREKGEEWMKKTADSYTITAALIITIVFAAAITVPGGNKGDTGKPYFETNPSFIIFAVSDAISLFTSTTSLLLFLSILTARYAEEDFLYKLPKRLILGLVMLFMSVTTMMIAFSATLYIMFGQGKSWILIPVAALACLPIASYVTLQLPLLYDLTSSTYFPGIFHKPREISGKK